LKKIKSLLWVLLALLIVAGIVKDALFDSPGAAKKIADRYEKKSGSPNTKTLVYKIYFFSLVPMNVFEFSTREDVSESFIGLKVFTAGSWIDRFIKASVSVESRKSREGRRPDTFIEIKNVKGKVKTKEILFDRESSVAVLGKVKVKITPGTLDPVRAVVNALEHPYGSNRTFEADFFTKKTIYILKSELIDEKDGVYEILMDLGKTDPSSTHGARLRVWVTADDARIPLVFKSWTPVGYASAVLSEVRDN